jgi:predicted O-linked N-acetylglucosamine transferase (SPINDLY family)
MDFRLVDAVTDPVGEADDRCTEQLLRFAPTAWCYAPPADAPLPLPGPGARGEGIAFGCFNNFSKVTDDLLAAWGRILAAVPGSRLVLKGFGLGEGPLRSAALARAAAAGIDPTRVELLGRTVGQAEHLAAYARVDVALDTFPYHGTTTTCEALWMGVPVITRVGDRHSSRVGLSLLEAVGHPEWVGADGEEYVAKAVALGRDGTRLGALRAALREDVRRSSLCDHAGQAERFGAALEEMARGRPMEMLRSGRQGA